MTDVTKSSSYPEEEAQRRFEAILRAALNTPPKPLKAVPRQRSKPKETQKGAKPSTT